MKFSNLFVATALFLSVGFAYAGNGNGNGNNGNHNGNGNGNNSAVANNNGNNGNHNGNGNGNGNGNNGNHNGNGNGNNGNHNGNGNGNNTSQASAYDFSDFVWENTSGSKNITVKLNQIHQNGFKYAVYNVDAFEAGDIKPLSSWTQFLDTNSGMVWQIQQGTNYVELPAGVTRLGVVAITKGVYSSDNAEDQFLFYRLAGSDSYNYHVSFGKVSDDHGKGNNRADITFGAPLPTPVVTLLIALALGSGFVMYRNRKQVKA